jgi:aminoglycoside 2'-N-acetyltransferase I
MTALRTVPSEELAPHDVSAIRGLLEEAFAEDPEGFTGDDWDHATGGLHFLLEEDGAVATHASVVERELHAGGHRLATGYVEAVATRPGLQGRGLGSAVMREVGRHIDREFQLGALGGDPAFYGRLGWVAWRGPTFVRTDAGLVRTPDEDGFVLVRRTPTTPPLDLTAPISCDWRPGDVW